MSIKCQDCDKIFVHKRNLLTHRKDRCQVMREKIIERSIILDKQNSELARQNIVLTETLKITKTELEFLREKNTNLLDMIEILKTEVAKKSAEGEFLKKKNTDLEFFKESSEIVSLKEKLTRAELSVAHRDGKLEVIEARAEKLENHILKENTKPRNNLTFNLAPYNLTKETVEQICSEYTADHFIAGPEATYNFILDRQIRAEDGRPRVKCTDISRKVFKGVCEDGSEFTDVGGKKIATTVSAPMKRAVRIAGNLVESLTDEDYSKKVSSHDRVLEPSRLSKRLAGDLSETDH